MLFRSDLRLAFPVPGIDGLRKSAESIKGAGLSKTGDFIFDAVGETAVEDVAECTIAIAVDLSGEAIELYDVLVDFLSFLHGQVVQLVLRVSNRIMRTKIGLQFGDELVVTVHPDGMGIGVGDIEQVRFEPLKGHTPKVGLRGLWQMPWVDSGNSTHIEREMRRACAGRNRQKCRVHRP